MHEFSPRRQKNQPTRIFLANSFLANISLDGSHRDTKYKALAELYAKDEAAVTSSEEDISAVRKSSEAPSSTTTGGLLRPDSMQPRHLKHKEKVGPVLRSNSMRSRQFSKSSLLTSSSESSLESQSTIDGDEARDHGLPMTEFKPRKGFDKANVRKLRSNEEESETLLSGKPKKPRQRRSSSGSHSKTVKLDPVLARREKASRTVSASSSESQPGRIPFYRSGSSSPGRNAANYLTSSPPIFEAKDDADLALAVHENQDPVEITLAEALSRPGEILDSHKGVITEKKELMLVANDKSQWPIGQFTYISKYRPETLDDETLEKHEAIFPVQPQSLIQRITAQFTRNNSTSSVGSSRNSAPSPVGTKRLPPPPSRRPWTTWNLRSALASQPIPAPPIRPRRISAASSIHIETEAGALENLLGIKLTDDPEDDLSYDNLLVPLAWNVDWVGDLTPEEAKSLLNTGEISVMSKLMGPAHPNSFDENYALTKLLKREMTEYRPKYRTINSQESSRSSQEPSSVERQFAVDVYKPGVLEDPEWETAVRRQNVYLESYFSSVIANDLDPVDKKDALNELFRGKFPYIQLSFSKFKSIKRDMQKACTDHQVRLDLAVVALSYVYFEKLVLKGFINKPNRKILASVCVVLAAKMNDLTKEEHGQLIHDIQSQMRVERDELNAFEFAVVVALGFDLHVPTRYVRYHYDILAKKNEKLPAVYLTPLVEPCPREKQRLSLTIRPIRQISLPGFASIANHRVNSRPLARRNK